MWSRGLIVQRYVRAVLLGPPPIPAIYHVSTENTTAPRLEYLSGIAYRASSEARLSSTGMDRRIAVGHCVSTFGSTSNDITNKQNADLKFCLAVNLRYTLDECLFSRRNTTDPLPAGQCSNSCAQISDSIQTNILTPDQSTAYDYCADPNFLQNAESCASCYRVIPNQIYLSNCEPPTLS